MFMITLDLFYIFLSGGVLIFILVGVFIAYKIWRLSSLINDLLEMFKLRLNKFKLVRNFLYIKGGDMYVKRKRRFI